MKLHKVGFLFLVLTTMSIVCYPAALRGAPSDELFTVVGSNEPAATIVISPDASKQVWQSAQLLRDYVQKATGTYMKLVTSTPDGPSIHVGNTGSFDADLKIPGDLEPQEFVIAFPRANHVVIAGGSDDGTKYGVLEFLERFVGVRWLFPGELGEYVPKLTQLKLPRTQVRQNPAFLLRRITLPKYARQVGTEGWRWMNRMRIYRIGWFWENMYQIYPPSRFLKDHPEFYPQGSNLSGNHTWNPCFTAPGIVEAGVQSIIEFLHSQPVETRTKVYSLAINDTSASCPGERCQAAYKKYGGVSGVYYRWANAVAEGVLKEFPDMKFQLLAYKELKVPPRGLKLHPSITPFITYDRMRWANPKVKAAQQAENARWEESAAQLGWYDYIYGYSDSDEPQLLGFKTPRIWFHLTADYLQYAKAHKVRYLYAEAYSHMKRWINGPRIYLTMKLYWDPYLDVDAVLDDWYLAAVGAESAPYLRRYFAFWEDYWTKRVPKLKGYLDGPSDHYLPQEVLDYMDLLTPEKLDELETLLTAMAQNAGPGKQKQRAEFFQESHKYMLKGVRRYLASRRDSLLEKMPAIRFSGKTRASIAGADLNFGDDDFIIELWMKPDSTSVSVLQNGRPGSSGTPGIQISTGGVALYVNLKGADYGFAKAESRYYLFDQAIRWHHLFLVFDRDGQLQFFKNAQPYGSRDIKAVGNLKTNDPFYLGFSGSRYYQGVFGPVRIYRFGRGEMPAGDKLESVLAYQYDHPAQVHEQLKPYLLARWDMNGKSPKMLHDSSGHGNHLTLSGRPTRLRRK